jgi:hypothetical protein
MAWVLLIYFASGGLIKHMSISPDLSRISTAGYSFRNTGMLPESVAKKNQISLSEKPARLSAAMPKFRQESCRPVNAELETSRSPAADKTSDAKSFSFQDVLDIINPLHHIPIIGSIYRAVTGDEIKAPARILGGGIFGGIIGAVAGLVNAVLSKVTGKDVGEHVMAAFKNNPNEKPEIIAGKNQTVASLVTATDVTGDAIEVPGNPEKFFPLRSLLPNKEPDAPMPAPESWTGIDPPNPTYPIHTHAPSSIHEKIQDVFLDFHTTEKTLFAVDFYQNISNIDRLTEDENQEEKRRGCIHMYG